MNLKAPKFWYKKVSLIAWILLPIAFIYRFIILMRKFFYQKFWRKYKFNVPIIVVGNISVGGAGKTPLVIYLAKCLQENNFRPGIISRGVGGKSANYPLAVTRESNVAETGDEALLIARNTNCPVVVAPNRVLAAKKLLATYPCNVIISDDGLQHYALARDIEIVVSDNRDFGNGYCLPAGPLREPISRLNSVDFIIQNNKFSQCAIAARGNITTYNMQFVINKIYNLENPNIVQPINYFIDKKIHAVAGIGNPDGFFAMLRSNKLNIIEHAFPDHYRFLARDISFNDNFPVLMTEKDAVKCCNFADQKCWCVLVKTMVIKEFAEKLLAKLDNLKSKKIV